MSGVTKILILLIILVCLGLFIKGPGGKPYISFDNLAFWSDKEGGESSTLRKVTSKVKESLPESIANKLPGSDKNSMDGADTVYKWKDENGVWHYTDSGNPPDEAEVMKVDSNNELIYLKRPKTSPSSAASTGHASAPATTQPDGGSATGAGTIADQQQPQGSEEMQGSKNPVRQALNIKRQVEAGYKQLEQMEKPQ